MKMFGGHRPDLTPVQATALAVGGVPVVSNLLSAFGVFTPTPEQIDALTNAVNWGVPLAGLLLAGDAGIRAARNHADAKVQAAAVIATPPTPVELDTDLPDDDEEFANQPPMQPSQTGVADPLP